VLHAWLESELLASWTRCQTAKSLPEDDNRAAWERWQAGLIIKPTLCDTLPPLRLLLIMDNLAGHLHRVLCVVVRTRHHAAVHPAQRILVEHDESSSGSWPSVLWPVRTPASPAELIEWLETTARAWNAIRHHSSGAANDEPVASVPADDVIPLGGFRSLHASTDPTTTQFMEQWRNSGQVTH